MTYFINLSGIALEWRWITFIILDLNPVLSTSEYIV